MPAVQATRATHSSESVIALCQIGRGAQAALVCLSLFEDALDVRSVAANQDKAPAMADEHEKLAGLGERATYEGFRKSWTLAGDGEPIELIKKR